MRTPLFSPAANRRDFLRLSAGSGAAALLGQLGVIGALGAGPARADASTFRAMVGVFLFGGADNWNMIVPTDARYSAYATGRGATLALPQASLVALPGVPFGLHPSFAPLTTAWNEGALAPVLNVGTLSQPLTKAQYQASSANRPLALFSHSDQQNEWQGLRMREVNRDGFMGRANDREAATTVPDLISLGGSSLILIGNRSSPLILPSNGGLTRNGFNAGATDAPTTTRQSALTAFADGGTGTTVTGTTATSLTNNYSLAVTANAVLTGTTSIVDQYFKNTVTGVALTSDVSKQLLRVARMIEARSTLGHSRQTFFASQGGYDTHANQVDAGSTTTGTQANLYADLAQALAAFYTAMKALSLGDNVTLFTMSDFGRTFRVNANAGTDHAWGNNHMVMGGAVKNQTVFGAYPDVTLGGVQDTDTNGRWIPTTALEEYIAPIAQWYGVAAADLPYVFPNYATWATLPRKLLGLFG